MTDTPEFDGPRLIQPGELRAARRLFHLCFGGPDLSATEPEEAESEGTALEVPQPQDESRYETCVISSQGVPVSQIILRFGQLRIHGSATRTGSIGGVCTHPDYRGRGLASRLLEYCARRLAEGGARLMVISSGRGLYTRAGSVPMGRFAVFSINRSASRPVDPVPAGNVRLRPAVPADAGLCSRLYQQEPAHFVRTKRAFQERFQPHAIGFQAEDFVVEMDGQDVAYLLLSVPWQYLGQPGAGLRQVAEYAGSQAALYGAILAAASQLQLNELQSPVAWQHAELMRRFQEGGYRPLWSGLPDHTQRVIDFPGLMSDLAAYARARLPRELRRGLRFGQAGPLLAGDSSDRYFILHGNDRLDLDGAAMTRLVMGDLEEMAEDISPPAAIAEIIQRLFPLPSFFTGLNYH